MPPYLKSNILLQAALMPSFMLVPQIAILSDICNYQLVCELESITRVMTDNNYILKKYSIVYTI